MSHGIAIRRFQAGDENQIQELINSIMTDEFGQAQDAYPTEDLQAISKHYGALGEAFFVALDGTKIVGSVGVKKENDRIALLRRLFVAPEYRSRKIGKQLLDHALQFCNEVGYTEVIFKTTSYMDKAIDLCKKRGFVQRAKLQLGPLELFKFALSLRGGLKASSLRA